MPDIYVICLQVRSDASFSFSCTRMPLFFHSSCSNNYFLFLQEMVDLTATNVALQSQSGKRSKEWTQNLTELLNKYSQQDPFVLVSTRYLVGAYIGVFIKEKYFPFLRNVQDTTAAVGVMGVMGNKGACAVRFQIFDSTFCFVGAHLAAHRHAIAQRNSDFATITSKIEFKDVFPSNSVIGSASSYGSASSSSNSGNTYGIDDHDFVVWLGDFNYRIMDSISTERCFELAYGGPKSLDQMLEADQLNIERAAGRTFPGYFEAPITFPPTYKFQVGTQRYEQRPEKKLRAPAWCDRVLYKVAPGVTEKHWRQLFYGSVASLVTSDHKPVVALFEAAVRSTIESRREFVLRDIAESLEAWERAEIPKLELLPTRLICIKNLRYGNVARREITLKNTGEVAAPWRVVPKVEEKLLRKSWYSIAPLYGILLPGESATLTVSFLVDDATARDVSAGRELAMSNLMAVQAATAQLQGSSPSPGGLDPSTSGVLGSVTGIPGLGNKTFAELACGILEDVIILRAERGQDLYIPITATVLPTVFGCSLAQITRRPEPIRAVGVTSSQTYARPTESESEKTTITPSSAKYPPQDLAAGTRSLLNLLSTTETDLSKSGSYDKEALGSNSHGIPKEVWRLVDAIIQSELGLATPGLFTAPGIPAQYPIVRECLDTGDAFPANTSPLTLAGCLVDLLSSLREPVVPTHLFPDPIALKHTTMEVWKSEMLRKLPALHYNLLVYIVRFAREILSAQHSSDRNLEGMAFELSRCLMRKIPHESAAVHAYNARAALAGQESGNEPPKLVRGASGSSRNVLANIDEDKGALSSPPAYADKGTWWEPTEQEQDAMTRVMTHLLNPSTSLVP